MIDLKYSVTCLPFSLLLVTFQLLLTHASSFFKRVPSATLVLHYLCYDDSRQISITKEKLAFLRFPRSCYDTHTCNRCKSKTNDPGNCSSVLSDANLYTFLWIRVKRFSDEWVVMQRCTLRAHHANISRFFPKPRAISVLHDISTCQKHDESRTLSTKRSPSMFARRVR